MSPIDFPDLLEGPNDRGRRKSGGLVSTLRSRSRSRSRARVERRAKSCQPTDRHRSKEDEKAEKKKRRSLSRPSRQPKESSSSPKIKSSKKVEVVDVTTRESRKKTRSPSPPSKRRSTVKASNGEKSKKKDSSKEWSPDIINLVDHDEDEDFLLSEILNGKNPTISSSKKSDKKSESKKSSSSDRMSKERKALSSSSHHRKKDSSPSRKERLSSSSNHGSPKSVGRFPESKAPSSYSDEEVSESEDLSEDEEEEANSVATNDLLDQVKSRMEQQRLMEEAKELRRVIEKKDAEIEQLTGQLRMAISTKCDLVIAHTELERLHEMDLKQRDMFAEDMKRNNLALIEMRAEVEKEFMNELTNLSKQVQEAEERRLQDVAEKDEIIRLLEEKIRRLELAAMGGQSVRRDNDKVKFYKKKLGVIDQ